LLEGILLREEVGKLEEFVVKSTCRMDHGGCGALVYIREGKVVRLEGNKEHPISKGHLCVKGLASIEHLYHPDRLKYPLKRVGEKGEGKWRRFSWDEALNEIADKIKEIKKEYGAEAIAVGTGTDRNSHFILFRLANVIGTPNFFSAGYVCYVPMVRATEVTAGGPWFSRFYYAYDVPPKCLVLWGSQASFVSDDTPHPCAPNFRNVLDKVEKFIVIDPRRTWEASKADLWLQVRPGTDGALALAMLNVIINEELYDRAFVEKWCYGFEKLRERVQKYPPEKMAEVTWIPADKIREAARIYATYRPGVIHSAMGLQHHVDTFQTLRSILCLIGITGNLDVPGGNVLSEPGMKRLATNLELWDRLPLEQAKKRIGADRFRLLSYGMWPLAHPPSVFKAIITGKPYAVKALLLFATNALVSYPNTRRVYEALRKVEFLVVTDIYMTPTAELADIVLPASTWLERDEYQLNQADWGIPVRQKVVQVGEAKGDWEIVLELIRKLDPSGPTLEQFLNQIVEPMGLSFDQLKREGFVKTLDKITYKKYEKERKFGTPSGKFELYSTILERLGYDPLPYYKEPPESPISTPELAKEYPLILITGARVPGFFHSEFRQIPSLRKLCPDPLVEIHPDTARELGINDGDWVWIETRVGRVRQRAKLTTGIHPKVVSAQHGWWFPEDKRAEPSLHGVWESNINVVIDDEPADEEFGCSVLRGVLCRIYKAESPPEILKVGSRA
jgi:anaerobic selenocysteine-containing dehydrogenase